MLTLILIINLEAAEGAKAKLEEATANGGKVIQHVSELTKVATEVYDSSQMLSAKGLMTKKFESLRKCYSMVSLEPCS